MIKKLIITALIMFFASDLNWSEAKTANLFEGNEQHEELDRWPMKVLSLAYSLRHDSSIREKFANGKELHGFENDAIYKLFKSPSTENKNIKPLPALFFIGHYCWIKLHPGFSCGNPEKRQFTDAGYIYVSDPIKQKQAEEPFLLIIMAGVSPRRTHIYRLFNDRLEPVYDMFNSKEYPCGITDPTVGLFATYGFDIDGDGNFILTEIERFHYPEYYTPRQFKLDITATSCHLTLIEQ